MVDDRDSGAKHTVASPWSMTDFPYPYATIVVFADDLVSIWQSFSFGPFNLLTITYPNNVIDHISNRQGVFVGPWWSFCRHSEDRTLPNKGLGVSFCRFERWQTRRPVIELWPLELLKFSFDIRRGHGQDINAIGELSSIK